MRKIARTVPQTEHEPPRAYTSLRVTSRAGLPAPAIGDRWTEDVNRSRRVLVEQ